MTTTTDARKLNAEAVEYVAAMSDTELADASERDLSPRIRRALRAELERRQEAADQSTQEAPGVGLSEEEAEVPEWARVLIDWAEPDSPDLLDFGGAQVPGKVRDLLTRAFNQAPASGLTEEEGGERLYRERGWSGCAGSAWDRLPPATQDAWNVAATYAARVAEVEAERDRAIEILHGNPQAVAARLHEAEARVNPLDRCSCGKPKSHTEDAEDACLVPLDRLQESNPSRWGNPSYERQGGDDE